jgi:hypothetical protein
VTVRKSASADEKSSGRPGGDDLPYVFSGILVVQGHSIAETRATGTRTMSYILCRARAHRRPSAVSSLAQVGSCCCPWMWYCSS